MSQPQSERAILHAPIGKTLWQMTWPMVFGVATLISFNVIDTFFISLLGTQELAAISFTFPVTFTVVSLSIGLGIGTSAVIARKLGQSKGRQARHAASSALYLAGILVAILAFIGWLLAEPIFRLLGAGDELMPFIMSYMNIWFAGAVLLVMPMIGNSILRAAGDTKTPSFIMALGGLLNAVFDPILIFGLGPIPALGMQGAAIASVLSWAIGFALIIYWLVVKKKIIDPIPPSLKVFIASSNNLLKIGLPASGANMLTPLSMAIITAIVASYGAAAVAGYGAGARLESIASVIVLALSMSLPPFISQNFGAGRMDRVRSAYRTALFAVLAIQALVYVVLVLSLPLIQLAFARDDEVAQVLAWFVLIMPLGYGVQGWVVLTNSAMNALHLPIRALSLSVVRLFALFVPLSFIGSWLGGLPGLFIGGVIANVITAIISYRWFIGTLDKQQESHGTQI